MVLFLNVSHIDIDNDPIVCAEVNHLVSAFFLAQIILLSFLVEDKCPKISFGTDLFLENLFLWPLFYVSCSWFPPKDKLLTISVFLFSSSLTVVVHFDYIDAITTSF